MGATTWPTTEDFAELTGRIDRLELPVIDILIRRTAIADFLDHVGRRVATDSPVAAAVGAMRTALEVYR